MRFVDPDGMQGEDWIKHRTHDEKWAITYDKSVHNIEQAKNAGYLVDDKEAVGFESAESVSTAGSHEEFEFFKDGKFSVNGAKKDSDDESYTSEGGTYISKNKDALDTFGDLLPNLLQDVGDTMTLAALPVSMTGAGAPLGAAMAEVGSNISLAGNCFGID